MSTTVIAKTGTFTIADADLGAGDDYVTYRCTGVFTITIPSTGVAVGSDFVLESSDGLQSISITGATVNLPAHRELVFYPNGAGETASISITCHATGIYKADGDLNPTEWGEISFRAHSIVNQDITTGDVIEFEVADHNNGSGYSITLDEFEATQDGTHRFGAGVGVASVPDGNYFSISIYVNGILKTSGQRVYSGGAADLLAVVSDEFELVETDKVEIRGLHDAGGTLATLEAATSVYFYGSLVGGIRGSAGVGHDNFDIAFRVYETTGTSIPEGTAFTKVGWDTAVYNFGDNFDLTTGIFTAPITGLYTLGGAFLMNIDDATTAIVQGGMWVDGTVKAYTNRNDSNNAYGHVRRTVSSDLYLTEGQEVDFRAAQDTNLTNARTLLTGERNTYFYGRLVHSNAKAECSFSAHMNGVDQTAGTGWQTAALGTVHFDSGGTFDTTLFRFVAPEKGKYILQGAGGVLSVAAGEEVMCAIYINNGEYHRVGARVEANRATPLITTSSVSAVLDLSKNDYAELRVYHSDPTARQIYGLDSYTYLTGYRLVTVPTEVYNPVVYEIEITTATDTIDVPPHLLGGTEYRIELAFVNDNVATSTITHAINGDTTGANYDRLSQLHQVGDETYSDDASVDINAAESGMSGVLRMHINAVNEVLMEDVVSIVQHSSNGTNRKTLAIVNNTTTFTTITSINFSSSVSTGFGVGTRLKILRD